MKNINEQYLLKIKELGIKIKNKKNISTLITDYGFHRIINCYGDLLKVLPKRMYNTKNIYKIFKIDKLISKTLIYYLLDFEQKLNARSIDVISNILGKGNNEYILSENDINFETLKNKNNFFEELFSSTKSCNCLMMYDDPRKIPLSDLSLSWSFHTLLTFISIQNDNIKSKILEKFNISDKYINEFISTCHSIRKFRNTISHNDILFVTTINFYRREFNSLLCYLCNKNYNLEKDITVFSLIEMLEKLLNENIKDEIFEIINKSRINKKLKELVLDYMNFN